MRLNGIVAFEPKNIIALSSFSSTSLDCQALSSFFSTSLDCQALSSFSSTSLDCQAYKHTSTTETKRVISQWYGQLHPDAAVSCFSIMCT
jgi:hypothetical protein